MPKQYKGKEYLTRADVAKLLGMSGVSVHKYAVDGKLSFITDMFQRLFLEEDVLAFEKDRKEALATKLNGD